MAMDCHSVQMEALIGVKKGEEGTASFCLPGGDGVGVVAHVNGFRGTLILSPVKVVMILCDTYQTHTPPPGVVHHPRDPAILHTHMT